MRYRVDLSDEAREQLSHFPRGVQEPMSRAVDELEAKDDSQWSNVMALQGAAGLSLVGRTASHPNAVHLAN